jgi:hypothetical protein
MRVEMKDVTTVLFALHLAKERGPKRNPDGSWTCPPWDPDSSRTCAMWDAVLPLSLPESTDPPITATWRALVKMCEEYVRLHDGNPVPRPTTIRDEEVAQASGLRGSA